MYKNLSPQALGVSGFQSELIELALSHGFKGLEIDVVEYLEQARTRGAEHARRLLVSAHVRLGGLRLPVHLTADDETFQAELQTLQNGAEALASAGADHLVTVLDPATDMLPYHEQFELCRKRLVALADVLDPHGIRVGVGFCGVASAREGKSFEFIHDLTALTTLVESAAESTGILLDVWEIVAAGGSVEDAKQIAPARVVAVQLADGPADRPADTWTESDRLLPGQTGVIDSAAVLAWLAQSGYEGPVTPKPDRSQFQGVTREAIVRQTADQLNAVWQEANLTPAGKPAPPVDQPA